MKTMKYVNAWESVSQYAAAVVFGFVLALLISSTAQAADIPREQNLNDNWRFLRVDDSNAPGPAAGPILNAATLDVSAWDAVTLPHTAHIEPKYVQNVWQGICWYRRTLAFNPDWQGKKVALEFGAAMQIADVWVNGTLKTHHLGGYLPFTVDITGDLHAGQDTTIAVRLDSRDTLLFPPAKTTRTLDFVYPGGLYRGVRLVVTNPVHVTNAIAANVEAGGGIFVTYDNVSQQSATVHIKTHVANDGSTDQSCHVDSILIDQGGNRVAMNETDAVNISASGDHAFEQTITVNAPKLWDPDHPFRYQLQTVILANGSEVDRLSTMIGIRTLKLTNSALLVNGKPFAIRGTNRHQEYPYIEYAMSPEASRRDARLIRDGGFNFVRLSHYPQDPAFLDECDKIGLMVQEPIPGWQQFVPSDSFISASYQFERDMIRRDRNHPSIVFWETNLNETHSPTDFRQMSQRIAHAEYPGDQCFTFGDPYPGAPWDVKGLIREYGDWQFGGNSSTSRHPRGDGEAALLQETWNFLWTDNYYLAPSSDPNHAFIGDATWCMFDYNRGYNANPCTCGMMDIVRLPKYVYSFFQSQRDPALLRDDVATGPMVSIANTWTQRPSPAKVVVFSNCQEVELQINGKTVTRQKPDAGPDTKYSQSGNSSTATVGNSTDDSGGNPFDGGNCTHLTHPPFTFTGVAWESGTIKAIGYIDNKPVADNQVTTAAKPAALRIEFSTAGIDLTANGSDVVFVRADVLDASGTIVPDAANQVTFKVTGPAKLIGENPTSAEAGIASILLQAATDAGKITIIAQSPGLPDATGTITSAAATGVN
jgi:beta-galactosidase